MSLARQAVYVGFFAVSLSACKEEQAPAPPASSSQAATQNQDAFKAKLTAAPAYKVGQPATVTVVVDALDKFHINEEYPYKFVLQDAPAGLRYDEKTIRTVSRTEKQATMTIPFTPEKAGTATISGECSLSVCTAENCVIDKVPLSVTVKVE